MKSNYFTLVFFLFGLFINAQTTPTGSSEEVGTTDGELSVSLSGGANYTIPITTFPGINGIVPQVSLIYNSQGGNGIAGYGWNIAGVSTISRIPSTKFHDNKVSGVNLDTLDRLALDGQRLILKTGTYWGDGSIYETENFSNLKITLKTIFMGSMGSYNCYFIVEYPDGSKAYYGNSTDSRSVTDWGIDYWENPQGVRISYSYTIAYNTLYISSIKYGSLTTTAPLNEIQFRYGGRQRTEEAYVGGLSIQNNRILSEITVGGISSGYRKYTLAYDKSSLGYDRLTSVTEKSGYGTKNPTVFSYGNNDVAITSKSATSNLGVGNINSQNSATISGDFDGDGKLDFALYPTTGPTLKKKFWVFTDIKNSSYVLPFVVECGSFEEIFPTTYLDSQKRMIPEQGITVVQLGASLTAMNFNVYRKTTYGVGLDYSKQVSFPARENCSALSIAMRGKKFLSGDFNGDGLTDVVAVDTPLWNSCEKAPIGKTYFIDLDRRRSTSFWNESGTLIDFKAEDKLEAFDVNGDGKTDVLHFSKGSVTVYTLNDNNQLVLLWKMLDASINTTFAILPGDYNGDGKMDFIIPQSEGVTSDSRYAKFVSTGTGFVKTIQTYAFRNLGSYEDKVAVNVSNLIPVDFNGDGKTDMVHFRSVFEKNNNTGRIIIKSYHNNGYTFTASNEFDTGLAKENLANIKGFPSPVFLSPSRNNQYLEVGAITDNLIYSFDIQKDFSKENLISTITTSNGVKESITYKALQQDSYDAYYIPKLYTETFPYVDIKTAPNFKIVTKLEKQSATVYKKQLFNYGGAVFNAEGLGFIGFRTAMRTNWHEEGSTSLISNIAINSISQRGANIENYSVLGNASLLKIPSTYITKTTLDNVGILLSNRVYKFSNKKKIEYNGLEDTRIETTNTYDAYNNITNFRIDNYEGNSRIRSISTNVEYENQPNSSVYFIGRLVKKTQDLYPPTEERYTYANHLLTKIEKKPNANYLENIIEEDNVYDAFGNIVQKTITATGLSPRKTSYQYDSSGRFLTQSTDIENLSTQFVYNSDGTLRSETNPYGLTTSYRYDSWGRKTATTDYLLKGRYYRYTRSGEKTILTITASDDSGSIEIFDDLGRKEKVSVKDVTGTYTSVDYKYDIYDRNYKVSEPYIGTSPTQWNETKYDNYGRVSETVDFTGKIVSITYDGLTTTVNENGKSKATTKNALGNIVAVKEFVKDSPGNLITYEYFANGHLKSSNYDGVKTIIEEDQYGRRSKLIDPSAGTYTYEYNTLGESIKETTPNGTTTYTLDAFGKLIQKTIVGTNKNTNSKTTYAYDSTSKLLLNTKFEDYTNGTNTISNVYTYDSFKRISKIVETTPFASFTKARNYDAFGRVANETSTAVAGGKSSLKAIRNIYKNGAHWQILDYSNSAVLWQVNTVNARGQILTAQCGPTSITKIYKDVFVSQYKYDKTAGAANILTLNTVFDSKNGNLTSRTNSAFNWNESFKYDSLDRLTNFINTQGKQETQTYDDKGRITKNNLGSYNYTKTDKPYQNSSIIPTPEALTYYTAKPTQIITYNTFKSPVLIDEAGVDKISFNYNDENSRTAMFYGGLQDNKLERPLRKFYSADGTMEVKQNIVTGVLEFVTYIGGDGYNAPIVVKSNGTTQNYLYLLRDYQGSILGITDANGAIVEKRLFDAWGAIISVKDGAGNVLNGLTILDRGYTGHEHLQTVALINMNGRIYDPKLHRFLQPDNYVQDPFNAQNYNRYGYVLNNPLKYIDPSGEWLGIDDAIAGVIGGLINLGVNIYQGNIHNIGQGFAAFGSGAAAGVLSLYGPAGWAAGGAIVGGTNAWLSGKDPLEGALMGAATSLVGGQLGQWASGALGGIVINGIKVTSPLLQGTIIGSLSSGTTGGIMNFGIALIGGANLSNALDAAGEGFSMGLVTGTISGAGSAYASSLKNGINPLNGNDLKAIDSDMVKIRHHTSVENMNKIKNSNQMTPSRDSGFGNLGVDFENTINFSGNQKDFTATNTGAFIELTVPKSILTPNPSPSFPNHVRIITGPQNLQITPEFRPKYYTNFYINF